MTPFPRRYLKFVAIGTPAIFVLGIVVVIGQATIYGSQLTGTWDIASVDLVVSLFLAAVLGLSRPVVPNLQDPDHR